MIKKLSPAYLKRIDEIVIRMKKILDSWDFPALQIHQDRLIEIASYIEESDDLLDAYLILRDFKELKHLMIYLKKAKKEFHQ